MLTEIAGRNARKAKAGILGQSTASLDVEGKCRPCNSVSAATFHASQQRRNYHSHKHQANTHRRARCMEARQIAAAVRMKMNRAPWAEST